MSEPYLGELRIFAFNFAPKGWAMCNGQLLAINQNQALFALLGTYYGGNGTTNFALPDLRSRVPLHVGQGSGLSSYAMGDKVGVEAVTLLLNQLPAHSHAVNASSGPANTSDPAGAFPANTAAVGANSYSNAANVTMNPNMIIPAGGGQPHTNIQPYLALNVCIALLGIFPSQN
jgi:microcystin-dependent protein